MQMRFMTCGEISSMTHFLQIRLRLSIATSLVIPWVCPDLLGEGKEIEKIISILAFAIMSSSLCKQPLILSIRMRNQTFLFNYSSLY